MQWKTFWSIFGASLSLAAAVIPTLYGITWWITAVVVSLVGIIVMIASGSIVRSADMFESLKFSQKGKITSYCRLAIGSDVLWVQLYVIQTDLWIWWLLALPIVGLATYWGSKAVEYRIAREKPAPIVVEPEVSQVVGDEDMIRRFRPVLTKAGYGQTEILRHDAILGDSGDLEANQFLVQTPATGK